MKTFLSYSVKLLLLGLALATLLSAGSLWLLRGGNFYKPTFLANSVKSTSFDYVVLGASTGLTTLNTQVIDSVLQSKGLNLSMDDTGIASAYLMLQHFLAEGKQMKLCILAPSVNSFNKIAEGLSDNDYRFAMYANRDYVSAHYKQFSGLNADVLWFAKYLPSPAVSYYNAELFYPSLVSGMRPNERNRFDEFGNYTYPVKFKTSKKIKDKTVLTINFHNPWLRQIESLCQQHDIELIYYLAPMRALSAELESNRKHIINHSDLLTSDALFYDAIHVNSLGRQKTSLDLAAQLKSYLDE